MTERIWNRSPCFEHQVVADGEIELSYWRRWLLLA
jgi:hypothetical protein